MPLDFAVLDQNGAPEKTVPLDVDLHHELVTTASTHGLTLFQSFADYYKDAEIAIDALPSLAEQVQTLRVQTSSVDLQRFLYDLGDLIAYAVANGKVFHAISD